MTLPKRDPVDDMQVLLYIIVTMGVIYGMSYVLFWIFVLFVFHLVL